MAVPSPITCAILGVPASNFHGSSLNETVSIDTSLIISPPPKNGSISLKISFLPYNTPTPVGPIIL